MTLESGTVSSELEEAPPVPTVVPPKPPDPGALAKAMARVQQGGGGALRGGELIPRRSIRFTMDHQECMEGIFTEDFVIRMDTLTPAEETKVLHGAGDPMSVVSLLAQAALADVNGTRLDDIGREFLWTAIGPGGRQIVIAMYNEIGAAAPMSWGKARESSSRL